MTGAIVMGRSASPAAAAGQVVVGKPCRMLPDQPPMQYLAHWRLQLAAQHLKPSDLPLKTIADRNGYESEAAFSRAFKRHFGLPPGDWRRRQTRG